jgi:hypothetical protein
VIENQLDATDHKHLGQIITYAAGIQANVLVWIAPEFRDEHRAAIDWLNQASISGFDFFAVQIEAYRIGVSLPAPRFNIVSKPNSWVKRVTAARRQAEIEPNEGRQRWVTYWAGLQGAAQNRFPAISDRATATSNWQPIVSITKGKDLFFQFNLSAPRGALRVELYIDGSLAKAAFRALETDRKAIETAFGATLTWDLIPDARASRISAYMPKVAGVLDEGGANHLRPTSQYEWFITTAPKFIAALRSFIEGINVGSLAANERDEGDGAP